MRSVREEKLGEAAEREVEEGRGCSGGVHWLNMALSFASTLCLRLFLCPSPPSWCAECIERRMERLGEAEEGSVTEVVSGEGGTSASSAPRLRLARAGRDGSDGEGREKEKPGEGDSPGDCREERVEEEE